MYLPIDNKESIEYFIFSKYVKCMLVYLHIFYIVLCIFMTPDFRISLKTSLLKWLVDIIFFSSC